MGILSKRGYGGESDNDRILIARIADWTDLDCLEYLGALDNRSNIEVSDFEAEFIESHLGSGEKASFSHKQRLVIAKMYDAYGN